MAPGVCGTVGAGAWRDSRGGTRRRWRRFPGQGRVGSPDTARGDGSSIPLRPLDSSSSCRLTEAGRAVYRFSRLGIEFAKHYFGASPRACRAATISRAAAGGKAGSAPRLRRRTPKPDEARGRAHMDLATADCEPRGPAGRPAALNAAKILDHGLQGGAVQ